jgi:hypothetical protein
MPFLAYARVEDLTMQFILKLTSLYFRIIVLRARPQDVPGTKEVFWISILAAIVSYVMVISSDYGLFDALGRVALDMVILLAILHGGLVFTGHRERFLQGYAAFCGTAALINIAFWPVFLEIAGTETAEVPNPLALAAFFGLYGWSVIVAAHIFRHCFGSSLMIGVLTSITYLIVVVTAANFLFSTMTRTVGVAG